MSLGNHGLTRDIRESVGSMNRKFWTSLALTAAIGLVGISPLGVHARSPAPQAQAAATASTVMLVNLPQQGRETYALILQGGPFPYDKDGVVFGNFERSLPAQKRGYYREYTVKTPYARNRGAKRIVCGGNQPRTPDACYYTDDHYASFKRIAN
jgi:ribonuclease T1